VQNIAGWCQQTFCFQSLLTMPSNVLPINSSKLSRQFSLKAVIGSNPGCLLKFFLLYQTSKKRKFMIFGSFQKQTRKMTVAWMVKNMPHCFDNFFADKENIYSRLFKICQSDTSNKVLTPISPNFLHIANIKWQFKWRQQDKSRNFLVGKGNVKK
jgi:hypothetical protein